MSRFTLALAGFVSCAVPAAAQTDWQRLPLVEHVRYPCMAFDAHRDVAVLFGGEAIGGPVSGTWLWDRDSWQHAAPAHEPPPRRQAAMAFDAQRGVVVLFGGRAADGTWLGDTWAWDGTDWTQLSPAQAPSPRALHAMTFDAARGCVLLFAGGSPSAWGLDDTWAWDGSTWLQQTPAHIPPPRAGAALAYNSQRQRVVMFGGSYFQFGEYHRSDTWEWDGSDWTDVSPPYSAQRPPARWSHGMVYDASRARTVLFAGSNETGHYENDTWEWDGDSWTAPQVTTPPESRLGLGSCYDPVAQHMLVFGGEYWMGRRSDLWTFDGFAWQLAAGPMQPPLQIFSGYEATVFDGDRGVLVWMGRVLGSPSIQQWEWNGARWQHRMAGQPVPEATRRGLHWLPSRHTIVLYRPLTNLSPDETWQYDGQQWTQLTTAHRPGVRTDFDIALAPRFDRLLLFGGRDAGGLRGSSWSFDGSDWQSVATTDGDPSPREGHAMALDAGRGRVVLFGGHDGYTPLDDTFEWDGQQWLARSPVKSPPARWQHAMAYDLARRRIVVHGGIGALGPTNNTWEWDGDQWRLRTTTTTTTPVSRHSLAHDFWRRETLAMATVLGGADGTLGGTWRYAADLPGSFEAFGNGCGGSEGAPAVWTPLGQLPYTDGTFTIGFSNLTGPVAFAAAGYSSTWWNGVPLPLDMQNFGYPGCDLLVAAESVVTLPITGGTSTWTLTIPATPSLVGTPFFVQALALDATGPTGLAMTPGSTGVIGGR